VYVNSIHSFIPYCLTTDPQPFPKRVLHVVQFSASYFNSQNSLFSLSHPVAAYVFSLIFPVLLIFPQSLTQFRLLEDSFYTRCNQTQLAFFYFSQDIPFLLDPTLL